MPFALSPKDFINNLSNPEKKQFAIEQLKLMGTSAVPYLIEGLETKPRILKEEVSQKRIVCAILLGKTKDKRGKIPLIKALSDNDKFVREASCLGLSYLKDKDTIKELKKALNDLSGNVKMRAGLALARLGDYSGKTMAIESINQDDITAQFLATDVLEELKAKDAIPILQSYINNPKSLSWTRVHSLLAIAKIEASELIKEEKLNYYDKTLKEHKQLEVTRWVCDELLKLITEKDPLSIKAEEILKKAGEEYDFPGGYCAYKALLMLEKRK